MSVPTFDRIALSNMYMSVIACTDWQLLNKYEGKWIRTLLLKIIADKWLWFTIWKIENSLCCSNERGIQHRKNLWFDTINNEEVSVCYVKLFATFAFFMDNDFDVFIV